MKRSQRLYCIDILDRIQRVESYTAPGREAFNNSSIRQDAVVFCFAIIGEAIKHLNDDLIAQQPHVDWRGFARFRDILVHQYHSTAIDLVWLAVKEELPPLKSAVTAMLNSLDDDTADP